MCTDFTDLNKCKDDFPLGKINQIVDVHRQLRRKGSARLFFWVTTRYGFIRKMKKKQVS
jgi:hypothetical protein